MALTKSRHLFVFVVAAILIAVAGCRTPVEQEGDLDVQLFERPGTSLASGPGGEWYVVARRGDTPQKFLTVEHDDETHLFVTDPLDERAAEILPLTRVDIDWFLDALEDTPHLRFHSDLDEIEVDGVLGLWDGGETEAIDWLGAQPQLRERAVVVPADLDISESKSMPSHVEGTVAVEGEAVDERHDPFPEIQGPYLVIPDGPVTDAIPRAAATKNTGLAGAAPAGLGWNLEDLPLEATVSSDADLRELAGEHTVEMLAAVQQGDVRLGFAAEGGPPNRGEARRPVALGESGFLIDEEVGDDGLEYALRAVDDLYRDHPLSAAYRLQQLDPVDGWHVDDNEWATELRHQDLVAAADFAPWMRTRLVGQQEALGPDIMLYLVRALTYMGRWDAALRYGDRTLQLFDEMPETTRAIGSARTRVLMSDAHRARGDDEALAVSLEVARDDYAEAGDSYRAALTDRRRVLATGESDSFVDVVEALGDAGADYEASRTLLLGAARQLATGETEESRDYFEMWRDRFADEAPQGLVALSWTLQERLQWRERGYADHRREFDVRTSPGWDAAVVSALTSYDRRGLEDDIELRELAERLVEGTRRSDAELFDAAIDRALGVICTDLIFTTDDVGAPGWLQLNCERRIDRLADRPAGVSSLLEGGFRFVQSGQLNAAANFEEYLFDRIAEGPQWAIAEGRVLLFRAARLEELTNPDEPTTDHREDDVVATIRDAFDALDRGVASEESPGVLRALGTEYDARGFDRHALALLDAARRAARDVGDDGAEFESALELARLRAELGRWNDLAVMDNVASPLHAARINLYRGHADLMRGRDDDGREMIERSIERSREFGEIQQFVIDGLAGRLAVDRGDFEALHRHVERAAETLDELPQSVADRDERRLLEARIRLLARVVATRLPEAGTPLGDGDHQIGEIQRLLSEIPPAMVPQVGAEFVAPAADAVDEPEELDQYRTLLSEMWRYSTTARDGLRRDLAREYSRLLIGDDELQAGARVVDSTLQQGLGVAPVRYRHHCYVSRIHRLERRTSLADFHLERCRVGGSDDETTARAELMAAMDRADAGVAYRVELVEMLRERLPQWAETEARQLGWLAEFVEPRRTEDDERHRQLREEMDQATGDERVDVAGELIDYLVETGQYDEADEILETRAELFFDDEDRASPQWHLWRIESMVRQLRPFDGFDYIDRALEEEPDWQPPQQARLDVLRAVAHLQLGQRLPAAARLREARGGEPDDELREMLDELESRLAPSRLDQ